jgi:hypothetical protein
VTPQREEPRFQRKRGSVGEHPGLERFVPPAIHIVLLSPLLHCPGAPDAQDVPAENPEKRVNRVACFDEMEDGRRNFAGCVSRRVCRSSQAAEQVNNDRDAEQRNDQV